MKVEISATGSLKGYLPKTGYMEIDSETTLETLKEICSIPKNIGCGYLVNGKMGMAKDVVKDGDKVKFIMIVGAG